MHTLLLTRVDHIIALLLAGFMEGTGIPWPGSVIMATIGMQSGGDWRVTLVLTVVFSLGYTLGSLAQYAVGLLVGPVALSWLPQRHRQRLERLIARWGFGAVCWTRPLAIGNYVSIPAGMVRMNPLLFSAGTFLGAVPWAVATLLAGRLASLRLGSIPAYLERWMVPGVAFLALGALLFWGGRILRSSSTSRRSQSVQRDGCSGAPGPD